MGRKVMAAMLVAVAALEIVPWLYAPVVGNSTLIFRSEQDLLSLRALLSDESIQVDLSSLCDSLVLCQVVTDSEPTSSGEGCVTDTGGAGASEKTRHVFVFAGTDESSSRSYKLAYTTCKVAAGEYQIDLERQGFRSRDQVDLQPMLYDSDSLLILSKALQDPGVSSTLIETLRHRHIAFCRVRYLGKEADPSILKFWFAAGEEVTGDPENGVLIEYDVEYSPATGEVAFTRVGG